MTRVATLAAARLAANAWSKRSVTLCWQHAMHSLSAVEPGVSAASSSSQESRQHQPADEQRPSSAVSCKTLLASNFRGQLTTLSATAPAARPGKPPGSSVHSSLVPFIVHQTWPLVWLPQGEEHGLNLLLDGRASLAVGGTDPPSLTSTVRRLGMASEKLILVGEFTAVEVHEVAQFRKQARQAAVSLSASAAGSSGTLKYLLDSGGHRTVDAAVAALQALGDEGSTPDHLPYRLLPEKCQHVDAAGWKQEVSLEEFAGAQPILQAPLLLAAIDGFNRSPRYRRQVAVLCTEELRCSIEDAFLVSMDRFGCDVAVKPASEGGSEATEQWRVLRFLFIMEATSVPALCLQMDLMLEIQS